MTATGKNRIMIYGLRAAVWPETTIGRTIARRCFSARPPKWTGLNRERDAVKRSSGADQVRPSA